MTSLMRIAMLCVAFFCGGPAAACAGELLLPGGDAVAVPGTDMSLTLTKVEDSRCPADVECVWEGKVQADILVERAGAEPAVMFLCNACSEADRSITVAGRKLTLVRLEPPRAVLDPMGRNPMLTDYTLVLEIGDE